MDGLGLINAPVCTYHYDTHIDLDLYGIVAHSIRNIVSLIAGYDILSIFRDPDLPLELYIRILQQTHTAFRRSAAQDPDVAAGIGGSGIVQIILGR